MSGEKFTKDHEWVRTDGDVVVVGITEYAQEQLGDVVFVDLPDAGKAVKTGGEAAVVESVKAASEIYAPIDGEVTETNPLLADDPAKINADALGEGWLFKMKVADPSQLDSLMDAAAYKDYVSSLD